MTTKLSEKEERASRDKYPTAVQGLRRVVQEGSLPDGPIEWIEVRFQASGEATYRYRAPREDETDGGVLGPA